MQTCGLGALDMVSHGHIIFYVHRGLTWIRRRPPSRDHVGRRKGGLLNVGKVVARVRVDGQLAEWAQREVGVRPHLGHVKDVDAVALGLGGVHELHENVPLREVALLDRVEQILHQVVRVLARHLDRLGAVHVLDAQPRLNVHLDVLEGAVLLGERVRVAAVGVHRADRPGRAAVAEQVQHLVDALGVANVKATEAVLVKASLEEAGQTGQGEYTLPKHIRIRQVGARVALVRAVKGRELDRVADEEDGLHG